MKNHNRLMAFLQVTVGLCLNVMALLLPYTARAYYLRFIAFVFHLPFYIFGKLAVYLFKKLNIDPAEL